MSRARRQKIDRCIKDKYLNYLKNRHPGNKWTWDAGSQARTFIYTTLLTTATWAASSTSSFKRLLVGE
ncbi:MAG TPA: hypothetical protein VE130_06955 [Nitrososphaeraceae archaeon]|nr:hypothetical protein [Nitrososphaeraceae archaeon]